MEEILVSRRGIGISQKIADKSRLGLEFQKERQGSKNSSDAAKQPDIISKIRVKTEDNPADYWHGHLLFFSVYEIAGSNSSSEYSDDKGSGAHRLFPLRNPHTSLRIFPPLPDFW